MYKEHLLFKAMQVNGLKSITAKHLALCSQSILFFIDLFPHLSEALLQPCSEVKRTLLRPELDRLKQVCSLSQAPKRKAV